MISNPIASSNAGVKEPFGVFNASMMYTNTTEACPNNWINPFDVPSGVGWVTSAAYCIPMGLVLTRKNPIAKADTNNNQLVVANASPTRPGIASSIPARIYGWRLRCLSENGG